MEQYLCCFVSYQQRDLADWLLIAEFAVNNQASAATKATPFFTNYGYHPRFNYTILPTDHSAQALDTQQFAQTVTKIREFLSTHMRTAQDRYEASINQSRTPVQSFQVGDEVLVSTKHMCTARQSRKLDLKPLGHFPVTKVESPYTYQLDQPSTVKLHPVFQVSLLDPAPSTPVTGEIIPLPSPIEVDDNLEYESEKILDSKKTRNGIKYYVKWTSHTQPMWEPAEYLQDSVVVDIFHQQYPKKPVLPSWHQIDVVPHTPSTC